MIYPPLTEAGVFPTEIKLLRFTVNLPRTLFEFTRSTEVSVVGKCRRTLLQHERIIARLSHIGVLKEFIRTIQTRIDISLRLLCTLHLIKEVRHVKVGDCLLEPTVRHIRHHFNGRFIEGQGFLISSQRDTGQCHIIVEPAKQVLVRPLR